MAAESKHEQFMLRCLELAKFAMRQNNTPVGSLVVMDDEIIGEGYECLPAGNAVTGHAEIIACQKAVDNTGSKRLEGATLYSTAEPCFMCSYVIRQCGISLVVYGIETPNVGGITSSHVILTDVNILGWSPAPQVLGGVLRSKCEKIRST